MRTLVLVAVVWLALAIGAIASGWVPRSKDGWLMFILFGPPLYVIVEAFFDWLYSISLVRALARHPSAVVRIGGLTLFFVVTSALALSAMIGGMWLYFHR